jgi:hypothetical protein
MGKTPDDAIELASGRPLQQDGAPARARWPSDPVASAARDRSGSRSPNDGSARNSTQLISFALPMLERLDGARRASSLAVCCKAAGYRTIKHYFNGMKPLPPVYSVRQVGNRWWIEARSDRPHPRAPDCRPLHPFPQLFSKSRERIRVRGTGVSPRTRYRVSQDTGECPSGHGHAPHNRVTLVVRPGVSSSTRTSPAAASRASALRFMLRSMPSSINSVPGRVTV